MCASCPAEGFGCVICKFFWDNGAKTQPRQNTAKALIMPLTIWNCVLSCKQQNYFSENGLILPGVTSRTELPGSNFLLPRFFNRWGFQVASLLLATSDFEP